MNKKLRIVIYIILALLWLIVGFVGMLALVLDDILTKFYSGLLFYTFSSLSILAVCSPFILKKCKVGAGKIPLYSLTISFVVITLCCTVYMGAHKHLETFSTHKWLTHPELRYLMAADLQKQDLVGKSLEEVYKLLGEPSLEQENYLDYYAGWNFIDPWIFRIYIENNIVVSASFFYA